MAELDLAYGDMPQLILFTLWMSSSHRPQLGACICSMLIPLILHAWIILEYLEMAAC